MAERYFPGEDALGKRITIATGERRPREIIGIVGNVRQTSLDSSADPHMYVPYFQTPLGYGTLVVRTAVSPSAMGAAVKREVLAVDPNQPIYGIRTMNERIDETVSDRRFNMLLLAVFAVAALLLAAVGIYGVISYMVTERTKEIGIRSALGASRSDILRLILRQAVALIALGLAIGLASAFALTRFLSSLLYGISATDFETFSLVSSLLFVVALAACYIPGRRATRVDPIIALRYE
jgi:putative ABC transport system permease protein